MTTFFSDYRIYLASASPRRRELLAAMGIDFTTISLSVEETYPEQMPPTEIATYLSQLKMSAIDLTPYPDNTVVITCDTIVVLGDKVLGKPKDKDEAMNILRQLSGKEHTVVSGITVATPTRQLSKDCQTKVRFKALTEADIQYYIDHFQPMDKAGAYGIQEWIGYVGIESISGSFYNVMGLPTHLLWEMMWEIVKKPVRQSDIRL
jgi:septum formation protein